MPAMLEVVALLQRQLLPEHPRLSAPLPPLFVRMPSRPRAVSLVTTRAVLLHPPRRRLCKRSLCRVPLSRRTTQCEVTSGTCWQ